MVNEKTPAPRKRRQEPLEGAEHLGEYTPEPALLEILARLTGAADWAAAKPDQKARAEAAAMQIHRAGLGPRTVGLVSEARVAELQGMQIESARTQRYRRKDFPSAHVTGNLWDENDLEEYLRWRVQTAPYPRRFKNRFAPKG